MKAAFIEQLGAPEVIRYGEFAMPQVGPGAALVHVAAVSVDNIDTYIRSGLYPVRADAMTYIIGRDSLGTVVDIGSEVTRFPQGDTVWANNHG